MQDGCLVLWSNFKTLERYHLFGPHYYLRMSTVQQGWLPSTYDEENRGNRDKGCLLLPLSSQQFWLPCVIQADLFSSLICLPLRMKCDIQVAGKKNKVLAKFKQKKRSQVKPDLCVLSVSLWVDPMVARQIASSSIREQCLSLGLSADWAWRRRRLLKHPWQSVWLARLEMVSLRSFLCVGPILFYFSRDVAASPIEVASGIKCRIHPTNVLIQQVFFEHSACAGNSKNACEIKPWVAGLQSSCSLLFWWW